MSRWIYKSYLLPVLCFFEIDLTEQMYKKSGPEPITAYRVPVRILGADHMITDLRSRFPAER